MSNSFPVKGLRELDNFLSAFPKNLQKGAVRSGLRAAAAIIRDEARFLAPHRTGKYARSIKTGSPRQNQDGTFSVTVRTDPRGNNHAFLGLFFEYGVAPHLIRARGSLATTKKGANAVGVGDVVLSSRIATRKARNEGLGSDVETRALKIGNNFVSGAVLHPGFSPKPHFRPALDNKAQEAVRAFADQITNYLHGKVGIEGPYVDVGEAA